MVAAYGYTEDEIYAAHSAAKKQEFKDKTGMPIAQVRCFIKKYVESMSKNATLAKTTGNNHRKAWD